MSAERDLSVVANRQLLSLSLNVRRQSHTHTERTKEGRKAELSLFYGEKGGREGGLQRTTTTHNAHEDVGLDKPYPPASRK